MNKINFNQTVGFPLSTNILDALQTAYSVFNALGNMAGNFAIISGCELVGSTVANGVVFVNGEIFEFRSGNVTDTVTIFEDVENRIFEDGYSKPVIFKRYIGFGSALPENTFTWANFKRVFPTTEIKAFKDNHEARLLDLEKKPAEMPIGTIIRFDQPYSVLPPAGWEDYYDDGGRVWVGHDPSDPDFSVLGKKSGEKTHALNSPELPLTEGVFSTITPTNNNGSGIISVVDAGNAEVGGSYSPLVKHKNMKISFGQNKAHNNLQPYITVRYIKKIS